MESTGKPDPIRDHAHNPWSGYSDQQGQPRLRSLDLLPIIALEIMARLREAGFSESDGQPRQVMCFAEESGEFVGAWRRYYGWARRNGSFREVSDEWADVIIAAFIAAITIGIDPMSALNSKLEKIFTRGWKDGNAGRSEEGN